MKFHNSYSEQHGVLLLQKHLSGEKFKQKVCSTISCTKSYAKNELCCATKLSTQELLFFLIILQSSACLDEDSAWDILRKKSIWVCFIPSSFWAFLYDAPYRYSKQKTVLKYGTECSGNFLVKIRIFFGKKYAKKKS